MNKSPEAFRTISEVSEVLDIPPHVLRFWESKFSQIRPVKRGGGRRYYRPADVDLLRGIRALLYHDGLTIKGVQKIIREQGARHVMSRGGGAAEVTLSPPDPSPDARTSGSSGAPAGAVDSAAVALAIRKLEEALESLRRPLPDDEDD